MELALLLHFWNMGGTVQIGPLGPYGTLILFLCIYLLVKTVEAVFRIIRGNKV